MEVILRDYLSFSRPLDDLRSQPLALGALADEVLAVLEARAEVAAVALKRSGGGARAVGDPRRLKEALLNLIANAIEATRQGGEVEVSVVGGTDQATIEIRDTGRAYSLSILSREVRRSTPADMQLLHLDHPVRLLALDSVHMADLSPFCHEARLINLDAVPMAETTDFEGESAGAWLMRQVPWSAAEHKIRAISASAAEARVLAIKAGGACLEICRLTEFEGRPITFARLIYPGDKHQLVAQFSPHALPGS